MSQSNSMKATERWGSVEVWRVEVGFVGLWKETVSLTEAEGVHKVKHASTDVEAAMSYPTNLTEISTESGNSKQQVNVDKTIFCWKKMPPRTFMAFERSHFLLQKKLQDRLTDLLGLLVVT